MPVMRKRNMIPAGSTSDNLVQGSDFEFVTDSIISLWASAGGFLLTLTLQAGTTVLGRDLAVNVRAATGAAGVNPTGDNFNNVLVNEDGLIFRELVEGTARLSLIARNNDGDAERSMNWMIEVQPLTIGAGIGAGAGAMFRR